MAYRCGRNFNKVNILSFTRTQIPWKLFRRFHMSIKSWLELLLKQRWSQWLKDTLLACVWSLRVILPTLQSDSPGSTDADVEENTQCRDLCEQQQEELQVELWGAATSAPDERLWTADPLHNGGHSWDRTLRDGRSQWPPDFPALDCEGVKDQRFLCLGCLPGDNSLSCCYLVIASRLNYFKDLDIWGSAMGSLVSSR